MFVSTYRFTTVPVTGVQRSRRRNTSYGYGAAAVVLSTVVILSLLCTSTTEALTINSVGILSLLCTAISTTEALVVNSVGICIKNCRYCKEMYHDHFDGGRCARFCLAGEGRHIVDCGVDNAIVPFFLERHE